MSAHLLYHCFGSVGYCYIQTEYSKVTMDAAEIRLLWQSSERSFPLRLFQMVERNKMCHNLELGFKCSFWLSLDGR